MSPRGKAFKYHQVDRISSLPDCVTSNILSRLPTRDALSTCVLSRDWKHKMTGIYNISIYDECGVYEGEDRSLWSNWVEAKLDSFRSFVDKVLDSNRNVSVRSVSLFLGATSRDTDAIRAVLGCAPHDSHDIRTWISKIVRLHVKNLTIVAVNTESNIVLPRILERATSLTELTLKLDCILEIRDLNWFAKLESLYLSGKTNFPIQLTNKRSPKSDQFLLSFPVLTNLELLKFEFVNVKLVELDVPELIHFKKTSWSPNPDDYMIKIRAPKLAHFVNDHGPIYEFVQCVPSLCYLEHMDLPRSKNIPASQVESRVTTLLKGSINLECLCLANESVEAFLAWKIVDFLPNFKQLKRLELERASPIELWKFLQATPYIEYLALHVYEFKQENPLKQLEEPVPPCIVSRLKEVKFICFCGGSWEIGMGKLLLRKAENLESMFLYRWNYKSLGSAEISRWMRELGPENSNRITIVDSYK